MKPLSLLLAFCFALQIIAVTSFGDESLEQRKIACQQALDMSPFGFREDHANAAYSLKQCDGKWQIEMIEDPSSGRATFKFKRDGNEILSLKGFSQSVFRISGSTLFFAHFSPVKTGCTVAAYNLDTGQEVWRSALVGIGKIAHEQYRNRVTLELSDQDAKGDATVTIAGSETAGDYMEVLDQKTGTQLAHRIYRRTP